MEALEESKQIEEIKEKYDRINETLDSEISNKIDIQIPVI